MSQPIVINIGALPNDGTGDPLRTAFNDTNLNFANVFTAGPVGSNVQIANNTILTTNTNGNLVLAPNGTGVVQSNVSLVPDQNRIRNLGSANRLWDTTYTQYLQTAYANIGTANISNIGNLTVSTGNIHILGGSNGYVLQTDGNGNLSWTAQTGGGGNGVPGGANTQVQYNNAGAFGGTAGFTFDNTSNTLSAVKINTTDVFNLNGIVLENSSLTQGPTAAVVIPTNTSSDPIQVNNTYGNIALQTGAGSGITASWSFNNDGSLSLPGGDLAGLGNVIGPGNISYPFGPGPVLLANTVGNNSAYFSLNAVANAEGVIGYVGIAQFGEGSTTGLIETVDGTGNSYSWYFQNDGTTAFPNYTFPNVDGANGQALTTNGTGILSWSNVSGGSAAGNAGDIQINVAGNIGADSTLRYVDNGGEMTLYADYLNAPGIFTSDIYAGDGTPSNITLTTSYGNATWTFNDLGGTVFPTLTVQRGDNPSGTITGQTLLFGNSNQEAIISTPDGVPGNEYSQRLVINPGAGNNYGEGGDIYLWAGRGGDGSGSGGDIKIRGGQGGANTVGGSGGDGGYIRIEAGDAASTGGYAGYIDITGGTSNAVGGYVTITGGSGQTQGGDANINGGFTNSGPGGRVNINGGGSGSGLSQYGNVNIVAGASTWAFDNTGSLTLPGSIIGSGNLYIAPDSNNTSGRLDIFLTVGPDIHIAGVGENLILGRDDTANVTVGVDGNVYVQAFAGGPSIWTYDYTGNLILPQGGIVHETSIPFGGLTGNTIALKPSGGTDADQQLLVYPTAGADFNHLHLTTGNLWNTEMFLGNDNLYVKLANTGNVVVNANDGVGGTGQWTFDTSGNLQLPGNYSTLGISAGGYTTTLVNDTTSVAIDGDNGIVTISVGGGSETYTFVDSFNSTSSANVLSLVTRNGDSNNSYASPQITMGYAGTGDYPQFIHTTHNASTPVDNTIEFWTSDGTQAGTFPANAVLGLTVTNGNIKTGNISATGNITGGNIVTSGSGGNITLTGGDILGAGNISAAGNITGNYFIGNGSQLTGITASVPSQTILPTIQTITVSDTSGVGNAGGGGSAFANVTVSNTIPVTEYGVIITSGTSSQKYATGALGSIPGTVKLNFTTGLNSAPFTVYAYVTSNAGTYYSNAATGTSGICLLAGTQIALSDGTRKAIEDITYTDKMLSWDFDRGCYAETTALWIKRGETGSQYNLLTFSDGTTLRTFDQHRIFNKQAGAFTYPMTDATPVGTVTVNEHGQEITLTNKQVIIDTIEYYNVITDHHMNLFSDTVLTSCRFNNIYPITDMKFVKDGRTLRTRAEFENIPDRFFYGLRLAEQTTDIETVEWYVNRLLSTEVSTESELTV